MKNAAPSVPTAATDNTNILVIDTNIRVIDLRGNGGGPTGSGLKLKRVAKWSSLFAIPYNM
jgi:hypothetical protein